MIEDRVVKFLEIVQGDPPSVSMAYYVSVDSTKVGRGVGICKRFNAIFGGVFPRHYTSPYGKYIMTSRG